MAGHGRYPRARLDAMPIRDAARHVSDRLQVKGPCRVWIVPTSGIVIRPVFDPRQPDPERYSFAGQFEPDAPLPEIAAALARFAPKVCPGCKQSLPRADFQSRADGRPVAYCRPCNRERNARYDSRRNRRRGIRPAPTPNRLNDLLRDMPGNRGPLLGAVEWMEAA